MKKLLITGASGLLGANLAFLLREKYAITGLYNSHKPSIKGVDLIKCDLAGDDALRTAVSVKADVIVNCAAIVNVDWCESHAEETYKVNALSAGIMAKAARETGASIVHISTDTVYKDTPNVAYKETSPLGTMNVYSEAKLRGEELVMSECPDNMIVRTTIYGYNHVDKESLGEWALNSLMNGKSIGMFTDVFFNAILVNDLAAALDVSIEKGLRGVFNIDSKGSISKYEFGVKIAEAFGLNRELIKPTSVVDFDFKAKRPNNMVSDVSRILEYVDLPTVEEGILHFRDLYRGNYRERLKKGV